MVKILPLYALLLCFFAFYANGQDANITAMEYYIDTDPGFGSGNSITLTAGTPQDINFAISTGGLSLGFHQLTIRSMDQNGNWSIQESRTFYVSPQNLNSPANINSLEYFFDSDPGYGSGNTLSVTSATDIDIQAAVTTSSLSAGFHTINFRAIDSDGTWGMEQSRVFYLNSVGQIANIEYFIDDDPGIGSATQVAVSPVQNTIDMDILVATNSLTIGNYTLGIRIEDTNGNYSFTETIPFNICDGANAGFTFTNVCSGTATQFTDISTATMAGDLYSWDFDSDGIEDDNTVGSTSFTYPSAGTYNASLVIDRGGCKDSIAIMVMVENIPTAAAGADQDICTDNTVLTATAASTGETGTWTTISGTGSISDVNDPVANLNGITTFSNQLRWTVINDLVGCSDFDEVTITSNQPITVSPSSNIVSLGQTINTDVPSTAIINPGDVLTTTITNQPTKGTATILVNGSIDYTPTDGTVGADTVRFQLCNQCNNCANSFLAIDIQNNAPIITPGTLSVDPGGKVSLDLLAIISDANNNLDPSSLRIVQQPISGALAVIDANFMLTIDYTGIVFVGTDQLSIEACDFIGACTTSVIFIEVNLPSDPPVTVYNAISPNGDGKHDFLEIENIDFYQGNKLIIFNRWGKKVFEVSDYDNDVVKFSGLGNTGGAKELPSGTYYYQLDLGNGTETTGFLVLKN
ncbi:MAG TPA: gliding motility-associated C-terminal domain-containing protein [Fulvivirga sp.]|nr:gliding motility-associated C-terminal domain-containing protein [Fulvivirga sp.]